MCTVAYFSVKAMLLLIDCKYKIQAVLAINGEAPTSVRVNKGKDYTPLKTLESGHESDSNSSKNSSTR
jgi:hypothetical protein